MKQLTKEQVLQFLNNKPGYSKEGAKRLSQKVLKGLATVETCRIALKEFNNAFSIKPNEFYNKELKKENKKLKVLIYDIETSYNLVSSWRVGNKVNLLPNSIVKERQIICVSWKWLDEDEVYTLDWGYKTQDDKYLLEVFIDVLNEADVIVAHNGDRFDLKWIRTRALKHGLEMLPYYNQVDTLSIARRYFYFNSNKLDYISKFLGFEGKMNTEPGLWDRVILEKDLDSLIQMINYCEEDVRQLEKVYKALSVWDKPKQHAGALLFDDKVSSPISGSKNIKLVKTTATPGGSIKRIMRDLDTNRLFEMSDSIYKRFLKEKQNETK